jgi:predicted ArsR family transcriptional regulator
VAGASAAERAGAPPLDNKYCLTDRGAVHDLDVIADPAAAAVALDPVRARLLAELRAPASAAGLAERVGLSRQKVNYHLRKLQAHGLVEPAGTRRWGGLTERLLSATAAGYLVSPEALGTAAAERPATRDHLSAAYLLALAGRVVREVGGMAARARRTGAALPVLALDADVRFASPADRAAFAEELTAAVTRLVARYHAEDAADGRWQRVVLAVHPVPAGATVGPPREEQP